MDTDEMLSLVRRLDAAEQQAQELRVMLVAFCLKTMDAKGVARLEKPILAKVPGFNVSVDVLKSGSIKFKVSEIENGS